jgi:hypothetical protein
MKGGTASAASSTRTTNPPMITNSRASMSSLQIQRVDRSYPDIDDDKEAMPHLRFRRRGAFR